MQLPYFYFILHKEHYTRVVYCMIIYNLYITVMPHCKWCCYSWSHLTSTFICHSGIDDCRKLRNTIFGKLPMAQCSYHISSKSIRLFSIWIMLMDRHDQPCICSFHAHLAKNKQQQHTIKITLHYILQTVSREEHI